MKGLIEIILILVVPGIFMIMYHLRLLDGRGNKSMYMADHIYAGRVYIGIPIGIAFILFAIAAVPQSVDVSSIIIYIGGGFGILALIFAFIQPSFLKPAWLKWLEREHGDIMSLLRAEVREMGDNVWNERIQTQADLEEWAAEVRRKYKL